MWTPNHVFTEAEVHSELKYIGLKIIEIQIQYRGKCKYSYETKLKCSAKLVHISLFQVKLYLVSNLKLIRLIDKISNFGTVFIFTNDIHQKTHEVFE